MQYRVQYLDGHASVIRELTADARNAVGAIALVADIDWPPHAVTMRVLDTDGNCGAYHWAAVNSHAHARPTVIGSSCDLVPRWRRFRWLPALPFLQSQPKRGGGTSSRGRKPTMTILGVASVASVYRILKAA